MTRKIVLIVFLFASSTSFKSSYIPEDAIRVKKEWLKKVNRNADMANGLAKIYSLFGRFKEEAYKVFGKMDAFITKEKGADFSIRYAVINN